ncbi:MAG: protein kinase [Nannocystaceae bacterium]
MDVRTRARSRWSAADRGIGVGATMSGGGQSGDPRGLDVESPISSGRRGADDWKPPAEFDEYRLVRPLGRGSMGQVYLAHDRVLDRAVAIKFISSLHASASERERFLVEARAAARLHHPNIMAIYRVGELDGNPYLVCEYIRGKSLNELDLPVSWNQGHRMAIGLARGLANAHRHGVLHRDVKLANVMVTDGDEVKILDFSLAKLIRGSKSRRRPAAKQRQRSAAHFAINAPIVEPTDAPSAPDETEPSELAADLLGTDDSIVDEHEATADPEGPIGGALESSPGQEMTPEVQARIEALVHWRDQTVLARGVVDGEPVIESGPAPAPPREPGWMNDSRRAPSLTQVGALMGTPHYMAPELWNGEPASRASDVYAAGIVLYALVTGRTPYAGLSLTELATAILKGDFRTIADASPTVDARFAAIIERCLRHNPSERYASGDELRSALELLTPVGRDRQIPTGNPYRGLRAFEAEHRALFFGRSIEIRAVVERLRGDAFVLVAGDSGVGKSSLCRAGVVPLILDGAIEPERMWSSVAMMPGRKPLQVLVSMLAGFLDGEEERLDTMIRESVVTFVWHLRRQLGAGRGLVIFIDQLEELVTISDRDQAALVGGVLSQIAAGVPGVRLLASARGDFLTRVAEIPELGEEISRAIYLLRPLTRDGAREAIAGPAELQGVRFEDEALIKDLVDAGVEGSLPLLQFALAELWEVRDVAGAVINRDHLEQIGGVTGALARHGDGALAALFPQQRIEARRILVRLVTIEDTRANLTADELVGESEEARAALEALVRSRLLVIRETADGVIYEIAHEALVSGWGTLRGWLDEEREGRILLHSLETAAGEWERLGKPRDALWGTAALTRAGLVLDESTLRARERAFLAASRSAVARGRRLRRAAIVAVPVAILGLYGGIKIQEYRALQARVSERIGEAKEALAEAHTREATLKVAREEAFALFDARDPAGGETRWAEVTALGPVIDGGYKDALQSLEAALILDPDTDEARALLASTLYERALLAEQDHDTNRVDELRERLDLYDEDGRYRARWDAPAHARIGVKPAGVRVSVAPYLRGEHGRLLLGEVRELGVTPIDEASLAPGSYLLTFTEGDRAIYYPLVTHRGETLEISFEIPEAARIPSGYTYIPPGRFLFGSTDSEMLRQSFFNAVPLHTVTTDGYLIADHEVTYGEWIDFLDTLGPEEQGARSPKTDEIGLARGPDGWALTLTIGGVEVIRRPGERVVYEARPIPRPQDWLRWPVLGLSVEDAEAYAAWVAASGTVPGARLCTGWEWERAARGADGRMYPHGDTLEPGDANFDLTYGKQDATVGPDEVGSFPTTRSPFGVDDMLGSAFEWTTPSMESEGQVLRGGSFSYDSIQARAYNRGLVPRTFRDWSSGMRLCAPLRPTK